MYFYYPLENALLPSCYGSGSDLKCKQIKSFIAWCVIHIPALISLAWIQSKKRLYYRVVWLWLEPYFNFFLNGLGLVALDWNCVIDIRWEISAQIYTLKRYIILPMLPYRIIPSFCIFVYMSLLALFLWTQLFSMWPPDREWLNGAKRLQIHKPKLMWT